MDFANYSAAALSAAAALLLAAPHTNAMETGENDMRISDMGPDGDVSFSGVLARVAYNANDNQYLIVWAGDDDTQPLVNNEFEMFGQFIDAESGAEITEDVRITNIGTDGAPGGAPIDAGVAHNTTDNQYLVVWISSSDLPGLDPNEIEVFGQRLNSNGARIGEPIRISTMGPDGSTSYSPDYADIAYSSTDNEYFVVWTSDHDSLGVVDNEYEVFGQRIDGESGDRIGDHIRLSDMGPDGDPDFHARAPAVTFNFVDNEYLVVWTADDDADGLADNEFEIFGQRVDASSGAEIDQDIRISRRRQSDDPNRAAEYPDVAHSPIANAYLVVWTKDVVDSAIADELEIFGRYFIPDGVSLRSDFQISTMGPDGDVEFDAFHPSVTYNTVNDEYFVAWQASDDTGTLVSGEFEIYGQRIDAALGTAIGTHFRLSDMGPDGDELFAARQPSVTYNPAANEILAVWHGDDDTGLLVDQEFEVYAQRFAGPATFSFTNAVTVVDEGAGNIEIEVRRIGDTSNTVTVDYMASNGTATDPSDYVAAAGTLTFSPNDASETFSIAIVDDQEDEDSETINLSLSNATPFSGEAALDSNLSGAVLTILDDDEPAPEPPPEPEPPPVADDPPPAPTGGGGGGGSLLWLPLWLALHRLRRALRS